MFNHSRLRLDACYVNIPNENKANIFEVISTAFKLGPDGNWLFKPQYGDHYILFTPEIHKRFVEELYTLQIWVIKAEETVKSDKPSTKERFNRLPNMRLDNSYSKIAKG